MALVKVTWIVFLAHCSCFQNEIQELTVYLLFNISYPLTGAILTIKAMFFASHISGFNVVVRQCIILYYTLKIYLFIALLL